MPAGMEPPQLWKTYQLLVLALKMCLPAGFLGSLCHRFIFFLSQELCRFGSVEKSKIFLQHLWNHGDFTDFMFP